jgi:hypothetical protein
MGKQEFNFQQHPKTLIYVLENNTFNRRCNRCGSVVLKELIKNYPFQCMSCDESLYEIETYLDAQQTHDEFIELCRNVCKILELDRKRCSDCKDY